MASYSCEACGRATTNLYIETPATHEAPAETVALCEDCDQDEHERCEALESAEVDRWIEEHGDDDV
jgi:hypothetical protein